MTSNKPLTHKEVSSRGGKAKLRKYGREEFSKMGKKWAAITKERDPDYFKRLAKAGLEARLKKQKERAASPVSKLFGIDTKRSS